MPDKSNLPAREFTLDLDTWLRGHMEPDGADTQLHTPSGMECCVGQFLRQNGVPVSELEYNACAGQVDYPVAREYAESINSGGANDLFHVKDIYGVNDSYQLSDEERIKRLKEAFALLNITMHVKGE